MNQASLPVRPALAAAEARGTGVRVVRSDGTARDYDCMWLRDGCGCRRCRHPQTLERTFNLLGVPQDLAAASAEVTAAGALKVVWSNDGHVSEYGADWFGDREELTGPRPHPRPRLWDSGLATRLHGHDHAEIMRDAEALHAWLVAIRDTGLALLRGAPREPGEVVRIAERIAYPRRTNFGSRFDVVARANPNSNAYTGLEIHGHTDLVFYRTPPGIFLLHCLANDAAGGDSTFADGFRVAAALRDEDPDAFAVLARVPFEFRFRDGDYDIRHRCPLIRLGEDGEAAEIRFNIQCMHAPAAAGEEMAAVYRAYRKFAALIDDARFKLRFRLAPGEVVGFDNSRVVHGRTAFDEAGGRHLQGIYVDHDEFLSRIRMLERSG